MLKKKYQFLNLYILKKSEFINNKFYLLKKINKNFRKFVIIRSASFNEDNNISNAGKYLSIPKFHLRIIICLNHL